MTRVAALVLLCFSATAAVSDETTLTASPGDTARLPCYPVGNVTPSLTTWMKNGREVIRGDGGSSSSSSPASRHLAVLHDGSLNIEEVTPGDEGSFLCSSTLPGNITYHARVLLQVTAGPVNVSVSVSPSTVLPNGTLVVRRNSTVVFNCSASSYPSQQLTWTFTGSGSGGDSLLSAPGPWLTYWIRNVQTRDQGVYSCRANNTVSHQTVNKSTELLVYYAPDRHPDCMWELSPDPTQVQFHCSWFGAYPAPTLAWGHVPHGEKEAHVYVTEATDSLSLMLNRSSLYEDQTVTCWARHQTLGEESTRTCSFTLKRPYPQGDPLVTALEADSVTLTCSETQSIPPANMTWRKGLQQDVIVPGSKYVVTEKGAELLLIIHNVTKYDEGVYFCRSENPLDVRELEVYLTVRTSSAYTGAVIGVFIAVLIAGSAAIIAKTVYSSRHRICLGNSFGQMEEDQGDVLSLVESDDEQIFQDAVPRLPPVTNGRQTTLVQIHRIPSSDHEDVETTDTSPRPQDDTVQTEEPEDLVTF